ncbi:MAG: YciI family protein [Steroidobacteraceae bacterium]
MLFLSLFTPAAAPSGPPSPEHMAEMGRLIETMSKAGVLVATGGIKSRKTGMKIARRQDRIAVEDGAVAGSSLMPAARYALLRAGSREELVRHLQKFLQVAGEGTCEIIEVMEPASRESSAAA